MTYDLRKYAGVTIRIAHVTRRFFHSFNVFYVIVILEYLIFEMIPINYRPIFIEGRMEASYPSSTTLLVLSVMPTLIFELKRRMKKGLVRKILIFVTASFSLFMVIGRTGRGAICFENCNLKMGIGQRISQY